MTSYCCCCCPTPVQALLNLWVRSGFSKSTVAAALTYFPPSPSLYTFERIDKNLQVLANDDYDDIPISEATTEDEFDMHLREDDGDSDLVSLDTINQNHDSKKSDGQHNEQLEHLDGEDESADPMSQLYEKNKRLKARADRRYKRDKLDQENGVTFRFIIDPRLRVAPSFSGGIQAIKIHCPKSKSYLAALVYRVDTEKMLQKRNGKPIRTIIYSHGNATDIGAMNLIQCLIARGLGVNVIVYDYSGYGESGGMVLEQNTYYDIEAVYMHTVQHLANGCPENVILYGQSVGSGPSCYLGAKKPAGGLILHSPFMSGMRVLTSSRALACLDIYPNIDRIKKIKCPVFIIHGMRDEEVTADHGITLHESVRKEYQYEPWWVPDRGHNDICEGPGRMTEYIRRLKKYMEYLDSREDAEVNFERGKTTSMKR